MIFVQRISYVAFSVHDGRHLNSLYSNYIKMVSAEHLSNKGKIKVTKKNS